MGGLAFTGTVWARGQETGSFKELTVLRGKYSSDYWQLWQRKLSSWPRSRASAVGWVDPVLGARGTTNQDEALWPLSRGLWRQTQDELARGQKGGREERQQAGAGCWQQSFVVCVGGSEVCPSGCEAGLPLLLKLGITRAPR